MLHTRFLTASSAVIGVISLSYLAIFDTDNHNITAEFQMKQSYQRNQTLRIPVAKIQIDKVVKPRRLLK